MESLCKAYHKAYMSWMKYFAKCLKENQKRIFYMSNFNKVPSELVIDSLKAELIHTLLREREEISEWCKDNEDPKEYYLPHLVREWKRFIEKYEEYEEAKSRVANITERLEQLGAKDE